QPLEAAARARQLGVPVYTIALGTPGGTIESPDAPGSGQRLAVPPDESTLRQIAELTGGRFFNAATAADLRAVYDTLGSRLGEAEELREVTAAFAGAATALLVAGGALALRWFHRFP
ncbi:MAG: VWA domain-containing protein, partial [Chloroflexota bacterium]|nr:VWA domain-containing protein [Chloroflexota bacterium]